MSTGSVAPFKPNQTTAKLSGGTASVSATITPVDSVLVYNSTVVMAFIAFGTGSATALVAGGASVPAGGSVLFGTGPNGNTVATILPSGSGSIYLTPETGTQR